jgi:hypothetical protein
MVVGQSTPINYQKVSLQAGNNCHCKECWIVGEHNCLHFSHIRLSMEHRYNNHSFQLIGLWVCVTGDITAQGACPLASLNRI